jgi:hypothetical protein
MISFVKLLGSKKSEDGRVWRAIITDGATKRICMRSGLYPDGVSAQKGIEEHLDRLWEIHAKDEVEVGSSTDKLRDLNFKALKNQISSITQVAQVKRVLFKIVGILQDVVSDSK